MPLPRATCNVKRRVAPQGFGQKNFQTVNAAAATAANAKASQQYPEPTPGTHKQMYSDSADRMREMTPNQRSPLHPPPSSPPSSPPPPPPSGHEGTVTATAA